MKPRQARITLFGILVTLLLAALAIPSLALQAYAEGEIIQATSFLEFANATVADVDNATYLVDKDTGLVNDEESFSEVFEEEFPEDEVAAWATIEESGDYLVSNEDEDTFYVSSTFGCKRLDVMATLTSLYGAEKGVTYEGETLLQFATEEATEAAYNQLVEIYGEDKVMADFVVWAMDAQGWGTETMGMDVQTSNINNYISAGTVSGDKVVVAVTDSGINPYHEVFSGCTISSKSTVIGQAGSSYIDDDGHGTMTAGIIAESCPANIEIMAVKVLNSKGSGSNTDCLNGIRYAVQNGADVINCSWGSKGSSNSSNRRTYLNNLNTYCKAAYDNNIIICASAGNDGQDMDEDYYTYTNSDNQQVTLTKPNWLPSECQYVICVGSVDQTNVTTTGQRSSFSNYGDALEFVAPGRSVMLASYTDNTSFSSHNGTSFSAPYVSAACALLKEYDRNISFQDTVQALASICRDFGDEGWDRTFGYGMPVFTDLEPLGHKWDTDNVTWEWTSDDAGGYSAATATMACTYDATHTNVQEATITSAPDGNQTTYTATASFDGVAYTDTKTVTDEQTPEASDSIYLAFGSDRHTVTSAIGTAMAGIPSGIVSYVGLAGDSASDTSDKTSAVLNEVIAALGNQLNATNVQEIYGNHDEVMVRDTDPDIIKVDTSGSSDVVYTGTDDDGNVLYYVWGIAYDDMVAWHNEQGANENYDAAAAAARAQAFKQWVDTVDPTIPIIVISHAPLHAKRGDNYSGAVWNEALNYAATGQDNVSASDTNCEIIRNVVFFHGHNHTSESALRTYLPYNASDSSTSDSRAVSFQSGESTVTAPIYYAYMTAGYLSKYAGQVSGHSSGAYNNSDQHSTLMEITDDQLKFYLFPAANIESATVRQTVNRVEPVELGELQSIAVDARNAKTAYTIGEELDLSGLVVRASYSTGNSRVVRNYSTNAETSVDLTTVGTYTVTVSYTEGDVTKEATFEVTVAEAPAQTTIDVYELASSLQAGGEYLIVNTNAAGDGYALTHSSGTVGSDAVTILPKSNLTSDVYIATGDVDEGSVWTAASESGNLKLKNGNRYLQISGTSSGWSTSYSISASTSQSYSSGAWSYSSSAHTLGYKYSSSGTRYLRYSSNAFTTSSSASYAIYLFKKTSITVPLYTVTFVNDDGTVLKAAQYTEGTAAADIEQPTTPTKDATAEFTYTFVGWDSEIADVTGNATYTATYTATKRSYAITWVDGDGNAIKTDQVEYGTVPSYEGDVPTKKATAQFTYSFTGWDTEPVAVTGEATYTAQFSETLRKYTITWLGDGDEQLGTDEVEYDAVPSYTGQEPTKAENEQFTYEFTGWDPTPVAVTSNATYRATFTRHTKVYTVTFVDEDGQSVLKEATEYPYGTAVANIVQPETPTKDATAEYTYAFAGWDPELATVTGNATYRATYEATAKPNEIVAHPQDATAAVGERFTLSVEATGTVTSYSWQNSRNGSSWSNVTWAGHDTATLTHKMSESLDGRMFRCVVTFSDGTSATSDPATVSLPAPSGRITGQPADAAAAEGERFTLSVVATDATAYSWQNSRDGSKWSDVAWSGHDTDTLSYKMSASLDGRMFRCVVTFADGATEPSEAATVTLATPETSRITGQPADAAVAEGERFTLSVEADGATAYSWQNSRDGAKWSDVAWTGHDTDTLSYKMSASLDGRKFRCVVTFADGATEASEAATVTLAVPATSRITGQPADAAVPAGERFTLSVVASDATAYSWQNSRDGAKWSDVAWSGHDTDTLSYKMASSLDGRKFRCVVTFSDGTTEASEAATVSLASAELA